MITWLQKYHRGLLIFIMLVGGIGLISLYNPAADLEALKSGNANRVAKLYGRTVDIETYRKYLRLFSLAQELQMSEYLQNLIGNPSATMDYEDLFVYNTMVLRNESDELQINPSEEELVAAIQELPTFQTDGRFDSAKLTTFLQDSLASRGFSQSQLEDIVRDSLRLKKLEKMIGSAVPPPISEARRYFDLGNQRTLIQAVKLRTADFSKDIQPSEEEIAKHYEMNEAMYRTEEKRRIEYVVFKTPEAPKPAEDPAKATENKDAPKPEAEPTEQERMDKVKRQDATARKATEFVGAIFSDTNPEAFKKKAEELGLEIKSTALYETNGFPADLMPLGQNAFRAAQQLTTEVPVSDAIAVNDDFAVLRLAEVVPSEPMKLEDAKPKVIEELKADLGKAKLEARADELRALFMDGIAAGKTFEDIAKEQKLTLLTPPPFRLNEPPYDFEDIQDLAKTAVYLKAGGVSERVDIPEGALIVHVKQREAADPNLWETEKESNLNALQEGLQRQFVSNWFKTTREKKAKLDRFAAATSAAKNG